MSTVETIISIAVSVVLLLVAIIGLGIVMDKSDRKK